MVLVIQTLLLINIDSGTLTISNTTSGDMTYYQTYWCYIDAHGGKISIDGTGGIDIGVETDDSQLILILQHLI